MFWADLYTLGERKTGGVDGRGLVLHRGMKFPLGGPLSL